MKIIMVGGLYILLIVGGTFLGGFLSHGIDIQIWPHNEPAVNRIIITVLLSYILLTALPFVPGVELGLGLIMIFGTKIVPVVYGATVVSLLLSFIVGRMVPDRWLVAAFRWLGFSRAAKLIEDLSALPTADRVAFLASNAPKAWIPWLLRHRLIALALLFNIPGSSLLGGGGGIAMAAGMSRLVTIPKFLLCVAIGVSPVPLFLLASAAIGKTWMQ